MAIPNLPVHLAYLRRGAGIWVGARGVAAGVFALASQLDAVLEPSPLFIPIVAVLGLADIGLARERTLLGNLGVTMPQVAMPLGAAAAMGEVAVGLLQLLFA